MKSSSESKPLPGARITRGEQLPYYAYVTAFLRTSLFLDTSYGTFSRENGISGQNRSKNKLVCKNAVTRVQGSCSLQVMDSCLYCIVMRISQFFELGQCTTLLIFLIFSTTERSSAYHQICSTDLKRIHLYLRYTKRPYFSITTDLISLLYVRFIYLLFHVFLSLWH